MNCKRCGALLTPEDQYCKSCGGAVEKENPQNVQSNLNVSNGIQQNNLNNQQQSMVQNNQPQQMEQSNMQYSQPQQVAQNNFNNQNVNASIPMQNENLTLGSINQPNFNSQMPNSSYDNAQNETLNYYQQNSNMISSNQPNNYGAYQNHSANNSSNNKKTINPMIIVICVMAVVIVGLIIFLVNGKDNNSSEISNSTTVAAGSTYKVNFNNFIFDMPNNLQYSIDGDYMAIYDDSKSWLVYLSIIDGSYDTIKQRYSMLKNSLEGKGYTAKDAEIKTLNGTEFITVEIIESSGQTGIGAYTKLNSMKVGIFEVYTQSQKYDYDLLKNLAPMVKSAKYSSSTTNMQVGSNHFKLKDVLNSIK